MLKSSKSALHNTLFVLIIGICLFPSIRSENDDSIIIQMPIDNESSDDICAGTTATQSSYPVKCFTTDPVCGIDGVTYWCGCAEAKHAGVRVRKRGFCDVGNGGNGSLSGQAFLLLHIVWLIVLGFSVLFGLL
ncbi:uncharacterized protein LOC124936672 [Impatiens glandulifera]|uniref:uncharacterized protein LOC124936672 n=1 Tax=Impatiens glandulifera TaxID=253017 RepID=UPI001FB17085|nr:uncharacterized protein LOC124936672 [Impatiens glandulifera]